MPDEALRARLQLVEATLDEVRGVLRHDARSPLAVILGQCELLDAGLGGPLTERQQKGIDAIRRQAERLERLLDDLLAEVVRGGADDARPPG